MQIPDWMIWVTAIGSFLAGLTAQTIVRVRSAGRGDGLQREWTLGFFAFFLAGIAVWIPCFGISSLIVQFS